MRDSEDGQTVKSIGEAMQIPEAYDLTGSLRAAAKLAGCDHKTVARLVAAREAAGGGLVVRERGGSLMDPFADKIDELVDRRPRRAYRLRVPSLTPAMTTPAPKLMSRGSRLRSFPLR